MKKSYLAPLARALNAGLFVAEHVAVASCLVGGISLIQRELKASGDPLLFDRVPVRYLFDAMDLGILLAFGTFGMIEAVAVFRERD